jgi:hypothetical protein
MGAVLGRPVIVENRAGGAAGMIGAKSVRRIGASLRANKKPNRWAAHH